MRALPAFAHQRAFCARTKPNEVETEGRLRWVRPRSSADRAADFESARGGSIPPGATPMETVSKLAATLAIVCCSAGGLCAAASAGVPTPVVVQRGFLTPSRNIACNAGPNRGQALLVCTVFSAATGRGQKLWHVRKYGRAGSGVLASNAATDFPPLRYGRTWLWHGIRCASRRTGLTCTNRDRHGFFLGRGGQRIF
jgi:hypothetical protein